MTRSRLVDDPERAGREGRHARAKLAIERSIKRLLSLRRADGSWQDHLPSAAVSTASAVIFLKIADPEGSAQLIANGARWLRHTQGEDGGWGDAPGAPAIRNVTPSALAALVVAEPEESREEIARARRCIEALGGMEAVRDREKTSLFVMALVHLSVAGLYDEREIHRMPVGLSLLPQSLRNRVSFILPIVFSWGVMQTHTRRGLLFRTLGRFAESHILRYFDELHAFHGPEGGYEESSLVVSLVGLSFERAGVRPDIVERCIRYLHRCVRPDGSWSVNRDLELSATTWVTQGLLDAGFGEDGSLDPTASWIRSCQRTTGFSATGCPAGGWGWSQPSGWPDTDDTANALVNLADLGAPPDDPAVRAGLDWLVSMQNRNGSWGCFCKDSMLDLDAPCAAMTAHAVIALARAGAMTAQSPPIARAVRWFEKHQQPDGRIPCLWYRPPTAGTGAALDALGCIGLAGSPVARRCREWLLTHQLDSGAWGDGDGSPPSVEETAWALLGLLGAGVDPRHEAVDRGVAWLLSEQRDDGSWDPTILGVYFMDLHYSDDLLATGYALQAIARYRSALEGRG
jgi:squalene-hopene/tetraprenyl-beta-curcumene cyclase